MAADGRRVAVITTNDTKIVLKFIFNINNVLFFSVIKIQTIFEYSRDDSKSVEKLEN